MYWDKNALYSPERIENTIEALNGEYDICGCHQLPIMKEDERIMIFNKSEFNTAWKATIAFRLSFLKYHEFILRSEEECSLWEMTDYPMKILKKEDIIQHIKFIEQSQNENDFYLQLFKKMNLFQYEGSIPF